MHSQARVGQSNVCSKVPPERIFVRASPWMYRSFAHVMAGRHEGRYAESCNRHRGRRVWGAGRRERGTGRRCKMHSAGRRPQSAGYRAQGTERRAQSPGRRDDGVKYETRMSSSA